MAYEDVQSLIREAIWGLYGGIIEVKFTRMTGNGGVLRGRFALEWFESSVSHVAPLGAQ